MNESSTNKLSQSVKDTKARFAGVQHRRERVEEWRNVHRDLKHLNTIRLIKYEAPDSVLKTIQTEAANKKIFRLMQCESKAKRKMFREEEKLRHSHLESTQFQDAVTVANDSEPLHRPTRVPKLPIKRQDPQEAVAVINQFRTLDLNLKSPTSDYAKSETSSMYNGPPSAIVPLDTSAGPSNSSTRPSTVMSSAISMSSRMSTAASIAESVSRQQQPSDEAFCQIPIPGRGRGARRKRNNQ